MSKVYLHRAGAPDKLLGHVKENGKVYRTAPGIDDRIGQVDLDTGKVLSENDRVERALGSSAVSS